MSFARLVRRLRPLYLIVKDVILFLIISLVIIQGWKLLDLDAVFNPWFNAMFRWLMAAEFALSAAILKPLVPFEVARDEFLILFPNGHSIFLFQGCSGLKQVVQFTLIMLIYPGSWQRKSWFIPLAAVVLIIAAIIHFVLLCLILFKTPDNYQFMHDHLSRWFFFTVFFLLWVWFERNDSQTAARSKPDVDAG